MSAREFGHDPEIPPGADPASLGSFEDVVACAGPDDRLCFAATRHDGLMAVEILNPWDDDGGLKPRAMAVLAGLGETRVERDGSDLVRAFYRGALPDGVTDGEPVVLDLPAGVRVRMYDRGLVPTTCEVLGSVEYQDPQPINQAALRTCVEVLGSA